MTFLNVDELDHPPHAMLDRTAARKVTGSGQEEMGGEITGRDTPSPLHHRSQLK